MAQYLDQVAYNKAEICRLFAISTEQLTQSLQRTSAVCANASRAMGEFSKQVEAWQRKHEEELRAKGLSDSERGADRNNERAHGDTGGSVHTTVI